MKRRIRKKLSAKAVKEMVDRIKKYNLPFKHNYGLGYYVFAFNGGSYNLHITFDALPEFKFGIWKIDNKYEFFGEHIYYIDKFKPSAVNFNFNSLDQMMDTVNTWIHDKYQYLSDMAIAYSDGNHGNWLKERLENKIYYEDFTYRNGLSEKEYHYSITKFNEIIKNIDTSRWDIFWKKSDGFHNLYDVWFYLYGDGSESQEGIELLYNNLTESFRDCHCFCFENRKMPKRYLNKKYLRKHYQWIVHPERKSFYKI